MSRTIRIDAEVEQFVLNNQREGETKQATLGRLVRSALGATEGAAMYEHLNEIITSAELAINEVHACRTKANET